MKPQDFDFRIWDNAKKQYDLNASLLEKKSDVEIELWTGLLDSNDKKIYEGDIVRISGGHSDDIALVKLNPRDGIRFAIKLINDVSDFQYVLDEGQKQETIRIIGNIHLNPECFIEKWKIEPNQRITQ